jgi:integrase/recombinase XerD
VCDQEHSRSYEAPVTNLGTSEQAGPAHTPDCSAADVEAQLLQDRWPVLGRHEQAAGWLRIWADIGRAPRTIDAYARGLAEYLEMCERHRVDPIGANRAHVAVFVRELTSRPSWRGANVVSVDSGSGLANATIQQRLVPVRLFYDFLVEEGVRQSNPVGRGRHTPGRRFGGHQRSLVPRMVKLPWIPTDQQWLEVLAVFRREPIRNRVMLALAYDAALRREELCCLRTDDLDPAHRMLRVRAETTKTRRERMVPYSAATGVLLADYLRHRATFSRARGPLFLSESRRNHAEPLTLWTWSKVVRRVALAADVPRFSTHTTRHLCLTDLARMGWELHAIATFAGHRSTESTLQYIHLSGRELSAKLNSCMAQIHAWRVEMLTEAGSGGPGGGAP